MMMMMIVMEMQTYWWLTIASFSQLLLLCGCSAYLCKATGSRPAGDFPRAKSTRTRFQ